MTNASEYRNLPFASLTEAPNNPRWTFEEAALNELAESIKRRAFFRRLSCGPWASTSR